ncbi:MAG: hypothetical protein ABIL68_16690 [bacterium]
MRKSIAVFLFLLFPLCVFSQATKWFEGSFDEALSKAGEDGRLVMLFFFSDN